MPHVLPERVTPLRLARAGERLDGALAIRDMARLTGRVRDLEGAVSISLAFRSEDGICSIEGRVSGQLALTCQRCMGPMDWRLDVPVATRVVASEREEADAEVECVRVDEDGDLALTAFVEEEILLALPEFTRHDPADCPVRLEDFAAPDAPPRESPFAVLAELKRDN